jgi:6-phosphogluconolactonase (cycloisomerase 2 family)
MKATTRFGTALAVVGAAFAFTCGSASARPGHSFGHPSDYRSDHPVFVQTDNTAGNQIVAYDRAANGTLTQAGIYNTGGLGGELEGSVVDHLASQGSLAYDQKDGLLLAVNAASNTIAVFGVSGDRLALRQVLSSGGSFPVSVAVDRGLVYVLNAEEGGSVQGYVVSAGRLSPIPGSNRALGLNPTESPQFTHTPGQVAFSPQGSQLVVTTKANGSDIDVFGVSAFGLLSKAPVVNSEPGAVPFAVAFDQEGALVVAEAGTNSLASFALRQDGSVSQLDSVRTEQEATCWVARAGSHFYVSNAASGSLSDFQSSAGGQLLTFLGDTETDAGTVDAAVSGRSRFLYVQAGGAGIVDEFAIGAQGALSKIGSVTVPGAAGGEGIVAL